MIKLIFNFFKNMRNDNKKDELIVYFFYLNIIKSNSNHINLILYDINSISITMGGGGINVNKIFKNKNPPF